MVFDIDKAVKYLDENAEVGPIGKCATYIRKALEAGGLDLSSRPLSAKDYGSYLQHMGFSSIVLDNYRPAKGDIVVIQNYKGGDIHGHIAMFDGAQWVSDFKQRDMWGGPGYRNNKPSHEVYRP